MSLAPLKTNLAHMQAGLSMADYCQRVARSSSTSSKAKLYINVMYASMIVSWLAFTDSILLAVRINAGSRQIMLVNLRQIMLVLNQVLILCESDKVYRHSNSQC